MYIRYTLPMAYKICSGEECLFHVKRAPYGVREARKNFYQGDHFHHYAWGIRTLEDAQQVCDQANGVPAPWQPAKN